MSGSEEKFEEEKFMKILVNLKDTQESIQGFSGWCIKNRKSAYKMARCWIKVIKKVRIEQKLVLFYLVNDIVQHSAKRGYSELLDKFRSGIKEAMPHLKEEKIGPKVQRCLDIWEEREVFDADYIQELTGLIDLTPVKEDEEIVENFQPPQLCTQIKIMKALEDDADYKLKTLKENDLDNKDIEEIKLRLKDKHCGDEFVHEFEDGTKRMEQYIKAMEREITKRRQVIELLGQGKKYYDSLYGEAEIVATAYSNFGQRVKKVAVKLKEKQLELAAMESPVPSPDYDAPSPAGSGDEMEIRMPDEQTSSSSPARPPPDLASRLSSMTGGGTDLIPGFLTGSNLSSLTDTVSEIPGLSSLTGGGDHVPRNAPKKDNYSISEFLTKMAQGEKVDVSSFIGGRDTESAAKKMRMSGERRRDEYDDPVPDWLSQNDSEEVENLALSRLRQAAQKNKEQGEAKAGNGLLASNLISLTGSPATRSRVQSGGTRRSCDMELSEGEEGEIPPWEDDKPTSHWDNVRERDGRDSRDGRDGRDGRVRRDSRDWMRSDDDHSRDEGRGWGRSRDEDRDWGRDRGGAGGHERLDWRRGSEVNHTRTVRHMASPPSPPSHRDNGHFSCVAPPAPTFTPSSSNYSGMHFPLRDTFSQKDSFSSPLQPPEPPFPPREPPFPPPEPCFPPAPPANIFATDRIPEGPPPSRISEGISSSRIPEELPSSHLRDGSPEGPSTTPLHDVPPPNNLHEAPPPNVAHDGPPPSLIHDGPPPNLLHEGPPRPPAGAAAHLRFRPPRFEGPPPGFGRGGFDGNQHSVERSSSFGGFESRGGGGQHRGFESSSPRFSGPPPMFQSPRGGRGGGSSCSGGFNSDNGELTADGGNSSDGTEAEGGGFNGQRGGGGFDGSPRGSFRGRGAGFRGGSDFDGGRGFGGGRGVGWGNGANMRRPWGPPRARGGRGGHW